MLSSAPTWRFGLGYLVVLPALAVADQANSFSAILKKLQGIKGLRNFGFIGIVVGVILALHVHIVQRPSYRLLDEAIDNRLVTLPPGEDRPHFNLLLSPRIWNIGYEFNKATGKIEAFQNVIIQEQTADVIYCRPENTERSNTCWDSPLPCSPDKLENIKLRQPMTGFNLGFEKDIPASQKRPVQPLNF